eukprot:UC1_evm1s1382
MATTMVVGSVLCEAQSWCGQDAAQIGLVAKGTRVFKLHAHHNFLVGNCCIACKLIAIGIASSVSKSPCSTDNSVTTTTTTIRPNSTITSATDTTDTATTTVF